MIMNGRVIYCCVILLYITTIPYSAVGEAVKVNWLGEDAPKTAVGISFGIPWKKGKLLEKTELCMKDAQGANVQLHPGP